MRKITLAKVDHNCFRFLLKLLLRNQKGIGVRRVNSCSSINETDLSLETIGTSTISVTLVAKVNLRSSNLFFAGQMIFGIFCGIFCGPLRCELTATTLIISKRRQQHPYEIPIDLKVSVFIYFGTGSIITLTSRILPESSD